MNWPWACVVITALLSIVAIMLIGMIRDYKAPQDPEEYIINVIAEAIRTNKLKI